MWQKKKSIFVTRALMNIFLALRLFLLMALNAQVLKTGFLDLSNNRPSSIENAAMRWAKAYGVYARSAQALDAVPTVLSDEVLHAAFLRSMQAQTFLTDLPQNLTAYWLTPPVSFVGPANTGLVAAIAGGPAFVAGIAAFIASNLASRDPQLSTLDQLAGLCHVFTLTVTATMTNIQSGVTVATTLL